MNIQHSSGRAGRHQSSSSYPHKQTGPEETPGTQTSRVRGMGSAPQKRKPLGQFRTRQHPSDTREQNYEDINRAFGYLKTSPSKALVEAERLLEKYRGNDSPYTRVVRLKARALLLFKDTDGCISYINSLSPELQGDKGVMMAKGRALQTKGCSAEALTIFQRLYHNHSTSIKDKKINGLALGRHLQFMGGTENQQKALDIFLQLRVRVAGQLGPCDDKEIELALGRLLQFMGGTENQQKALDIFLQLRAQANGQKEDIPCDDKEIELALGRHLQGMGGIHNLKKALEIFLQLRARVAGRDTLCYDDEVDLALETIYKEMGMWEKSDELQCEKQSFLQSEAFFALSIRSCQEALETEDISSARFTSLVGETIKNAARAVESSRGKRASCISLLACCFRLLSLCPKDWLKHFGIEQKKPQEFRTTADSLFAAASQLEPGQKVLEKSQPWRQKTQALLDRLKMQQAPK